MKNRARAQKIAPMQAKLLVPTRSERTPLKGATHKTIKGKEVITSPTSLAL